MDGGKLFMRSSNVSDVITAPAPSWKFGLMMWVLKGMSWDQRLDITAASGFNGGEIVTDWRGWSTAERSHYAAKAKSLGLVFDLMFPSTFGLVDASTHRQLQDHVREAIPVAKEFGCKQFSFMSGNRIAGMSTGQEHAAIADGLRAAAEACAGEDIEVIVEPIDVLENKTATINSVQDAFAIVRSIGNPKIKVLYDLYHEQRGTGNLIETLEKNIDLVGLIHIADVPGRHRPGTGEMNYANIYRKLAQLNYNRYITMEFYPLGDPVTEFKAAKAEALAAAQSA
jgi:hydroxypyruvate isomerase